MRQVPNYLLIGDGRLARHLSFYFNSQHISFLKWSRSSGLDLESLVSKSSHILLAISDKAIESFIKENLIDTDKTLIHFSGSLQTDLAHGFHPLMTFSQTLYEQEFYELIPFMNFSELEFLDVFPALKNPNQKLDKSLMPFYHSLCVMGGNFTTLLWAKCLDSFSEIGLDANMIKPYMQKVFENTLDDPIKHLTGPLIRDDQETMTRNINSIHDDKLKQLYTSFVDVGQGMEL